MLTAGRGRRLRGSSTERGVRLPGLQSEAVRGRHREGFCGATAAPGCGAGSRGVNTGPHAAPPGLPLARPLGTRLLEALGQGGWGRSARTPGAAIGREHSLASTGFRDRRQVACATLTGRRAFPPVGLGPQRKPDVFGLPVFSSVGSRGPSERAPHAAPHAALTSEGKRVLPGDASRRAKAAEPRTRPGAQRRAARGGAGPEALPSPPRVPERAPALNPLRWPHLALSGKG